MERGALACAVGTDEPEDATLFDAQINAVERDGLAEGFAQAACFDDVHGFGFSFATASSSFAFKPSR